MRIMKTLDKKTDDGRTYYKYRINLPKEAVEKLKLEDKELEVKIEKDRIVIKKK